MAIILFFSDSMQKLGPVKFFFRHILAESTTFTPDS